MGNARGWYKPERTLDMIVEEKMHVLEDFYAVDKENYDEVKSDLICAIREHPTFDPDAVADRFARDLIMQKLA